MALIELDRITKSYRAGDTPVPVLSGIDLRIEQGDFVAIMGQSGSGKSTLMNVLGCLDNDVQGDYRLDGADVRRLSPAELAAIRNRTIGFVFQSFNLIKRMSVLENVALPLRYAGMGGGAARAKAMAELERIGLAALHGRTPAQLSGGQQQRVAIARALACDPRLILADEPTGNLDSQTSEDIMDVFVQLNAQGITVILVTHEPDIAAWARRLIRLKDGRVIHDGPVAAGLATTRAPLEPPCS